MGAIQENWNPRFLAVFAAVFLLAFAACGDEDNSGLGEGPGPDYQRTDQRSGSGNGSPGNLPVDSSPEDSSPAGDSLAGDPDEDGKLPDRDHGDRTRGIWPQVWSQHAPGIQSWQYKVNCNDDAECFLSDLTSVVVTTPSGDQIELEKDFNVNDFSGEVTRRWVLYGPRNGNLPVRGDYVFSYWRGSDLVYEQSIPYDSGVIAYPTGVEWERTGSDITVNWTPPVEASEGMHYKALIWQVGDTPELFISQVFDWDDVSGVMRNVPMLEGGKYSLNVAIYFDDGFAYSDYVIFDWPPVNN